MAGTLGQYVRQETPKDACILTCYHVVQAAPSEPSPEAKEASSFVCSIIVWPADDYLSPMLASLVVGLARDREQLLWYETDPAESTVVEKLRARIQADVAVREGLITQRTIGTVCAANFRLPTPVNPSSSSGCVLVRVIITYTAALNAISSFPKRVCSSFTGSAELQGREKLSLIGRTSGPRTAC
ncbi:hypothetical protein BCR37DRAFT_388408 [Protomyces lactucae-debilis]|uniref:Uncharacterized protein n=1 Tax=Protomyces lactucae-debilis TaxID=2754530 RepID=A0A1Y2F9D8_PROLT|nr:uncharacterized protein BCR37DRAFT_388408 [Protomyces lactucae-debilis]ORY80054.1 hypothetical protein BCR37DRAFT_388408 [Protomyces lactucae-debilis]